MSLKPAEINIYLVFSGSVEILKLSLSGGGGNSFCMFWRASLTMVN